MLTLSLHSQTPQTFAVDNFDQAMNPRLARATMKSFCDNLIQNNKVAFITTHSPLVLDALDLTNDRIKLFTMDRNKKGAAIVSPVLVTSELSESSLSRLWLSGALGGVPNL
jgi:AAA15 family ATPase/GTPase